MNTTATQVTGKNYIGNQLSDNGNKTYTTFNPELNKENNTVFTEATQEEINQAVNLASEAFKEFRTISGARKAEFLNAIADEILALDDVVDANILFRNRIARRTSKRRKRKNSWSVKKFCNLVAEGSWVDATIDTAIPDREPMPKSDIRKMNIPLGPVVVFGASNFPLAYSTAGGDTAAALAAGCPVIVKSHPMHAGTGELVASAIIKAAEKTNMPNGVFSNLNSSGIEVGQQLVSHSGVKAVGFTGSIRGGRALLDLAAKREEPIPVFAEMGSVNPVIILPKALENRGEGLAITYASSVALGTGQFCTNPGLILGIKGENLTNFTNELAKNIVAINPSCMLHPNIVGAYESNKAKALSQSGLVVVADYENEVQSNYATQVITTVEGNTFLENPTLHQEVFGPYSMVVQCEDENQLEEIISQLEGQLTGTVISDDNEVSDYPTVISALQNRVGRIIFNGVPTGVEVCPSMVHGGPYPSSTDSRFTAVGIHSIKRWVRPFSYQDWPNELLPNELKNENPLAISRLVNNKQTTTKI